MNPVGPTPAEPVSARARDLHATLRVADLHADSLLWGRDLLVRGTRGHVDVPRLIEGGVALQVLSMPVKTPRGINIERNTDTTDQVLAIALAKRWPPATWRRLLPRVLHLAATARRFADDSGGDFRLIGTQADLAAYLAERVVEPRHDRRRALDRGRPRARRRPGQRRRRRGCRDPDDLAGPLLRHGVRWAPRTASSRAGSRRRAARWCAGWRLAA